MTKNIIIIIFITIINIILYPSPIYAQSSEVTQVYDLADKEIKQGDILSFDQQGIKRTNIAYDIHLFGISQDSPLMVFKRVDGIGQPVVRNGIAEVNVTTINGPIAAGDYLTSSEIPGMGMKADLSGYVVGIALKAFGETDGQSLQFKDQTIRSGTVTVALKIEYADLTNPRTNRLFEYLGTALFRNIQDPKGLAQIIKYIVAGLVIIISLLLGLIMLARSMPKAIEAIGRNPLAKNSIQFSMVLNIVLTIIIALFGLAAAFFILRL